MPLTSWLNLICLSLDADVHIPQGHFLSRGGGKTVYAKKNKNENLEFSRTGGEIFPLRRPLYWSTFDGKFVQFYHKKNTTSTLLWIYYQSKHMLKENGLYKFR